MIANIYQELRFCSEAWPQKPTSVRQEKALTDFREGEERLFVYRNLMCPEKTEYCKKKVSLQPNIKATI